MSLDTGAGGIGISDKSKLKQGIRGWFLKIRKFWHKKSHLFQLFDNEFELVLFVILKVAGNPDVRERVAGGFENSDTPGRGRSENLRFWRMS